MNNPIKCQRCGNQCSADDTFWQDGRLVCPECDKHSRVEQIRLERKADLLKTIASCCTFSFDARDQADFDRRDRDGSRCNG